MDTLPVASFGNDFSLFLALPSTVSVVPEDISAPLFVVDLDCSIVLCDCDCVSVSFLGVPGGALGERDETLLEYASSP